MTSLLFKLNLTCLSYRALLEGEVLSEERPLPGTLSHYLSLQILKNT